MKSEKLVLGGAITTAFGAALCCIGPVFFAILGFGAFSAASMFTSLRPYLLVLAVLTLAFAFYRTYFQRKACTPDQGCTTKSVSKVNRIILWIASILVVAFALAPYYIGYIAVAFIQQKQTAPSVTAQSNSLKTEIVVIEGMTCDSCEIPIKAVLDKTPGLRAANVSFKNGNAHVQYDSKQTSLDKIKKAINSTGYKAK